MMLLKTSAAVLTFALLSLFNDLCEANYKNQLRNNEYDYIVVGGGSSGSVIANRLSEEEGESVLLLEAGKAPVQHSEVPLFATDLIQDPDMTWPYFLEPQPEAYLNQRGQSIFYPRGKTLGGSSAVNFMVYVRGNRRDFDEWQNMGAEGWNWDSVFPYFLKSQDQTDPKYADSVYHSRGGYLTVSSANYSTPLREAYLEAVQSLGHQILDINGESQLGFSSLQFTTREGLRCSAEKAFLRPAAKRDNLDILTGAYVTRVKLDDNKRVLGVQFEHQNRSLFVAVRKEVILSAGAVGTPKILMLSGIGPADHLQELGIPLLVDLPVGQNFQDHVGVAGSAYVLNSSVSIVNQRDIDRKAISDLLSGRGPLTLPLKLEVVGFINSKYQNEKSWPDLQIFFLSGLMEHIIDKSDSFEELDDVVSAVTIVLRPKSKGFIKLRSADPIDPPIIDPKYLTEDTDVKILGEGLKFLDEVFATAPLQQFGASKIPKKGCEDMDSKSDEYFICMGRRHTTHTFHPVGSCKMGSPTDPTTVVDPRLKVKGVIGLRVADASVMPQVVSGNTNAACIMIGEKAADIIRGRI